MPDGEDIHLDWYPKHYDDMDQSTPIIMVVPGINSDSRAMYTKKYVMRAYNTYGFRSVIFNRRGTVKMPYKVKPTYMTWCDTSDADNTVKYLNSKYRHCNLFLQGMSMGASYLQRYCGMKGKEGTILNVRALGCISSPYCGHKAVEQISKSAYIDTALTKGMIKSVKEHLHEQIYIDTIRERNIDIGIHSII